MNMEINFTIVVQAINFFIAYLILRWSLSPLMRAVNSRAQEIDFIERSIIGCEYDMERATQLHHGRWQLFSEYVAEKLAVIEKTFIEGQSQLVTTPQTRIATNQLTIDKVTLERIALLVAQDIGKANSVR